MTAPEQTMETHYRLCLLAVDGKRWLEQWEMSPSECLPDSDRYQDVESAWAAIPKGDRKTLIVLRVEVVGSGD